MVNATTVHHSAGSGMVEQFFLTGGASAEPRWYPGAVIRMLALGEQTGGQYSIFEAMTRRGEEVPLHTHTHEDEGLFVLSGEINCEIGGELVVARGIRIPAYARLHHAGWVRAHLPGVQ